MPRLLIIAICTKSQKEGVNQSDEVARGGEEVAVSIGFINTFSMTAGLIGPNIASSLRSFTGSYTWVAVAGSGFMFIAFVMMLSLKIMKKYGIGQLPGMEDDMDVSLHKV